MEGDLVVKEMGKRKIFKTEEQGTGSLLTNCPYQSWATLPIVPWNFALYQGLPLSLWSTI